MENLLNKSRCCWGRKSGFPHPRTAIRFLFATVPGVSFVIRIQFRSELYCIGFPVFHLSTRLIIVIGMVITIEKNTFREAVHTAARFAERRSATLPALAGIAIVAGDDGIKLRATNLETGIDFEASRDRSRAREWSFYLPTSCARSRALSRAPGSLRSSTRAIRPSSPRAWVKAHSRRFPPKIFPSFPFQNPQKQR
jgi:hypothetical protein